MKKVLFLLLLTVCSIPVLNAENANNPYVHCLVLDKTMSMTGHGGTNIWADVQNYCYEWIDGIPESSTVLFYTFDKDLHGPQKFVINSNDDKQKIKDVIENIKVDGTRTYISSNLEKVVSQIKNDYPKSEYNKRIYLLTDGIEEDPVADFAKVLQNYGSWRGDFDYLYYVDLRDLASDATKKVIEETQGAELGTGFAKFLTISPIFQKVNCRIGGTCSFEQRFLVSNDALLSSMSFDLKIDSVKTIGGVNIAPNIEIKPSRNIAKQQMTKMEEDKYKVLFSIVFNNDSSCECDIYVGLSGRNQGNKIINFEPAGFTIQVRNKPAPKVKVKNGGGWH